MAYLNNNVQQGVNTTVAIDGQMSFNPETGTFTGGADMFSDSSFFTIEYQNP